MSGKAKTANMKGNDVNNNYSSSLSPLYTLPTNPQTVIVVGDAGVGKSSILNSFKSRIFQESYDPTIGIDFFVSEMVLPDPFSKSKGTCQMKLQIWDCAGQERFRSMPKQYYRHAKGALLVFDLCDRRTLDNLDGWLRDILGESSEDSEPLIWVVGNKKDEWDKRKKKIATLQEKQPMQVFPFTSSSSSSSCPPSSSSSSTITGLSQSQLEKSDSLKQKAERVLCDMDEVQEWCTKRGHSYVSCSAKYNTHDKNLDDLFLSFGFELAKRFTVFHKNGKKQQPQKAEEKSSRERRQQQQQQQRVEESTSLLKKPQSTTTVSAQGTQDAQGSKPSLTGIILDRKQDSTESKQCCFM